VLRVYLPTTKEFKSDLSLWRKSLRDDGSPYRLLIAYRGVSNSFTIQDIGEKHINQERCKSVVNPNSGEMEWMLAGEFAREWLKKLYPPFHLSKRYDQERGAPMLFTGQFNNRDLVYFDLVGAYHQIYSRLWLDFCEIGQRCKYPLAPIANELSDWKASRNALVGNLASKRVIVMLGNDWKEQSTLGSRRYYNPMILYFANTVLHELAFQACKSGCCYVATDGFIFPYESNWRVFFDLLDRLGFKFRCIIGNGTILRWAAYQIRGEAKRGDKEIATTKTYTEIRNVLSNPIFVGDPRIKRLLAIWKRPLRRVDRLPEMCYNEYWSRLK